MVTTTLSGTRHGKPLFWHWFPTYQVVPHLAQFWIVMAVEEVLNKNVVNQKPASFLLTCDEDTSSISPTHLRHSGHLFWVLWQQMVVSWDRNACSIIRCESKYTTSSNFPLRCELYKLALCYLLIAKRLRFWMIITSLLLHRKRVQWGAVYFILCLHICKSNSDFTYTHWLLNRHGRGLN